MKGFAAKFGFTVAILSLLSVPGLPNVASSSVRSVQNELVGTKWMWVGTHMRDERASVPDPANYTLEFVTDSQVLVQADITANKNMVPFDDKSAFVTSGIRVGVPAITTRGMKAEHMQFVVNSLDNVLMNADDANVISTVRKQVNDFMSQFELYPEMG